MVDNYPRSRLLDHLENEMQIRYGAYIFQYLCFVGRDLGPTHITPPRRVGHIPEQHYLG